MPDTIALVRSLTAAAGLSPSEEEIETLAAAYPVLRAAADRLQEIAADTDPAPVFDPVPLFPSDRSLPAGRS